MFIKLSLDDSISFIKGFEVAFKLNFYYTNNPYSLLKISENRGFPGCPVVRNLPCIAGDVGSIPGWELRSYMLQGNLSLRATTA